jgi:N-acetylmuramoyl-L-alanine amidase
VSYPRASFAIKIILFFILSANINAATIVIDPGHGGNSYGCENGQTKEKDIVLKISLEIKKQLEQSTSFTVILIRTSDTAVKIQERNNQIISTSPTILVSIHCNSSSNHKLKGIEYYYYYDKKLCQTFEKEFSKDPYFKSNSRGIQKIPYLILMNSFVKDAALIEIGYLDHVEEFKLVTNNDFQMKTAAIIADGIKTFLGAGK